MRIKALKMLAALVSVCLSLMCMQHAQAQTWSQMDTPTTEKLNCIWGSSGVDIFAAGANGVIIHYNGLAWSPMASGATNQLWGIWGSSGSDVFAVGEDGAILHYNGLFWTPMASGTSNHLYGVWGTSGTNVFAVGRIGTLLHYDGKGWSPVSTGEIIGFTGIWGSSSTDIFIVRDDSLIQHYNGTAWSAIASGADPSSYFGGIWGSSGSDVFAVGAAGTIVHYNGTAWSGMVSGATSDLSGIWGSSGSDIFAVGNGGVVLHYDGASWKPAGIVFLGPVPNAVWGSSSTNVFLAGTGGSIYHGTTGGGICSFSMAADAGQLKGLHDLRDAKLGTVLGAWIASAYYQNMAEISAIISGSDDLRGRFSSIIRSTMPAVRALVQDGRAEIPADSLLEAHAFLSDLQAHAGMRLRLDVGFILQGIESGWLLQLMGVTVK